MTRDDFAELIEIYGANDKRWPDHSRDAGLAFAKNNSADARLLLDEARLLDNALERSRLDPGTDILRARIMNALGPQDSLPATIQQPSLGLGYKAIAAMMAISFTLGFAGSNLLGNATLPDDTISLIAENEWESLATDYGMDDVLVWVNESPAP